MDNPILKNTLIVLVIATIGLFGFTYYKNVQREKREQAKIERQQAEQEAQRQKIQAEQEAKAKLEQETINKVQTSVKNLLKDPNSAQFKDTFIHTGKNGTTVCGYVNAKNALGGYVGFRGFLMKTEGMAQPMMQSDDNDTIFAATWQLGCVE